MSTDLTTVKVSKRVRERIARASRSQHVPANEFLDRLVSDWERRQRMAAVASAMNNASEAERAAFEAESELWDPATADGLDS
ncbi:MAG: hypothetical protein Q8P38_11675 [Candidatus Nanopelagicales bacterium]|nr:hypothetical protein [Candidatus Nanopelagicales bacterium]MDZ7577586.1 hypothetical protein [Candidatus Nanopelagicales bacterium]